MYEIGYYGFCTCSPAFQPCPLHSQIVQQPCQYCYASYGVDLFAGNLVKPNPEDMDPQELEEFQLASDESYIAPMVEVIANSSFDDILL